MFNTMMVIVKYILINSKKYIKFLFEEIKIKNVNEKGEWFLMSSPLSNVYKERKHNKQSENLERKGKKEKKKKQRGEGKFLLLILDFL